MLEFNWTTNIEDVQLDILQRIDMTPLPNDAQKPNFLKFDPSQFPIIQLSLRAENDQSRYAVLAESLEKRASSYRRGCECQCFWQIGRRSTSNIG
ncbi:hypothetical protein LSPH24S_06650 [Lysinibacillus sphaericus]